MAFSGPLRARCWSTSRCPFASTLKAAPTSPATTSRSPPRIWSGSGLQSRAPPRKCTPPRVASCRSCAVSRRNGGEHDHHCCRDRSQMRNTVRLGRGRAADHPFFDASFRKASRERRAHSARSRSSASAAACQRARCSSEQRIPIVTGNWTGLAALFFAMSGV